MIVAARGGRSRSGFALAELLVALLLSSILAAGLVQELLVAQRSRRQSGNWMRATQLAVEKMERIRAGDGEAEDEPIGSFRRSASTGSTAQPGLRRVMVRVEWEDVEHHEFTLTALIAQR